MLKFIQLVPYLFLEDRLWSYCETIATNEISLALVAEIRVVLKKGFKTVLTWLEFAVLVFEHTDSPSRVDYQNLYSPGDTSNIQGRYFSIGFLERAEVFACGDELFVVVDFACDLKGAFFAILPVISSRTHLLITNATI
jgi:hypothetical protein